MDMEASRDMRYRCEPHWRVLIQIAGTFPLVGCLKMGMDLSTLGYETTNSWQ
jgi:hypothetical protein